MKMGRREIFSWGGGYLENEEKRESKGIISLLPILIQGPPREIRSSPHFHNKIINHIFTEKFTKT